MYCSHSNSLQEHRTEKVIFFLFIQGVDNNYKVHLPLSAPVTLGDLCEEVHKLVGVV